MTTPRQFPAQGTMAFSARVAFIPASPYASAFITRFAGTSSLRPSLSSHRLVRHVVRHASTTMKDTTLTESQRPAGAGIQSADLRQEMTRSYMEYAMSVILGRAMPDVRDGFKPVHRRILFAMNQLGLSPSGPFRKSARVVGEVLGKYHPHGDIAVYDALVRMAQTFSMSIPLINGHGNFGSTDGDPPAAMRYTECKLAPLARDAVLGELNRDTVSLHPNFDGSEQEPLVLPIKYPNLLVNGSSGIAVGMATNIPPHNLGEIIRALVALIRDPSLSDDRLFSLVPGPDFPTGGQILGTAGARAMYQTGRGRIVVRACVHPETLRTEASRRADREAIVITELPYQVNKASLVERIAELVNQKKIDGVSDLRDESDRNGTRIVIELKRDAKFPVVLSNLFDKTPMENAFFANIMALDNGQFPKRFSLRECLTKFLAFRRSTLRRRVAYDLKQAEDRLHVVLGFVIVLNNLDAVVSLIRGASEASVARDALMENFKLSERQASAVLDMQLRRLTALEKQRLESEQVELETTAQELTEILDSEALVDDIIVEELREIGAKFGSPRRSTIIKGEALEGTEVDELSLVSNDLSVITVTKKGYMKRMASSMFVSQNRGTRGKRGLGQLRAGDKIEHLFTCMTHDSLIAVSSEGTAYHLQALKVPQAGLGSRGVPLFQLLPAVAPGKTMAGVVPVSESGRIGPSGEPEFLLLMTKKGYMKKVAVEEVVRLNSRGKRVITVEEGDELKWVKRCTEHDNIIIVSQSGYVLKFQADASQLRSFGRAARGVRAMRLGASDSIADMDVHADDDSKSEDKNYLLVVTQNGKGKRVGVDIFMCKKRARTGLRGIRLLEDKKKASTSRDKVTAAQVCKEGDSLMLLASDGTMVKTKVKNIPVQGRFSQGVALQRLGRMVSVAAVTILPGHLAGEEDDDDVVSLDEIDETEDVLDELDEEDDVKVDEEDEEDEDDDSDVEENAVDKNTSSNE